MKDIKIVTWTGNGNFGTTLQAYALHEKLRLMGYQVSILNQLTTTHTLKNFAKYILSHTGILTHKYKISEKTPEWEKKLLKFKNEHLNQTSTHIDFESEKMIADTDVFITGSDQIWNTWFSFNTFYFLNFANGKKRVAYASSMGTADFPEEHKPIIKKLLLEFNNIGVREAAAVSAIQRLTGRTDVKKVLDPTFLLTADDWTRMTNGNEIEIELPDNYILCYLIGNNSWYKEQIQAVKTVYDIQKVIIIPAIENKDINIPEAIVYSDAGPKEFVRLIEQSSLVCTDSFHATALSINLKKDFVEFMRFKDKDEKSQNSRIYNVLERYGLMYKIYDSNNNDWSKKIDYTTINKILEDDRKRSLEFLINSIES